jgi:putative acetyltransferase
LSLAFRDARSGDVDELLDLWVESWSEVYAGIDFGARRGWFAEHMAAWSARGGLTRVAADPGSSTISGFILIDPAGGLLDQICVRRSFKGAGVARLLLEESRRLAPDGIDLDVNAMNARAIRFYEREGFQRVGEGVNPTSGLPTFRYRWRP